jgi:hypothetical protein
MNLFVLFGEKNYGNFASCATRNDADFRLFSDDTPSPNKAINSFLITFLTLRNTDNACTLV